MSTHRLSILAFAAFTLAAAMGACATPKSAAEHRALASQEDAEAAEHRARYDESARATALAPTDDGRAMAAVEYNPTHWEKVEADAHARSADKHRAAARELEESEDAACADTPHAARSACPLLFPTKVDDFARGVRVTFADEASASRAAAMIRCQQAFAVARAFQDLPTCALYGRNLSVTQRGAAIEIVSSSPDDIERLRANVRGHHPG